MWIIILYLVITGLVMMNLWPDPQQKKDWIEVLLSVMLAFAWPVAMIITMVGFITEKAMGKNTTDEL